MKTEWCDVCGKEIYPRPIIPNKMGYSIEHDFSKFNEIGAVVKAKIKLQIAIPDNQHDVCYECMDKALRLSCAQAYNQAHLNGITNNE